jgi:RNA polymerase sigma factor (TIGR02999 family)
LPTFRLEADHTLQPTALVHELYLRFAKRQSVHWEGPSHFFGAAAQMMRRLLVDHARMRQTAKRGAGAVKLPLTDDLPVRGHDPEEMLALDEALDRLQAMQPRQAKVMELKSFTGLTNVEIAKTLGVGLTVVKGDPELRREVEALLASDAAPHGLVDVASVPIRSSGRSDAAASASSTWRPESTTSSSRSPSR